MNGLLITSLLLLSPLTACAQQDGIEGRWTLHHTKPGMTEEETVELLVRPGDGQAVSAEVSIPGVIVPFEGTFDPATGVLALIAHKGDESATIDLVLRDGRLTGEGDLPIGELTFDGVRAVGAPAELPTIAFEGPLPTGSLTGGLPPELEAACQEAIDDAMRAGPIVGLSAAIVIDGEVVEVLSAGWQDHEADIPASAQTMYRWASVSKPLTTVAALQLVESGDLSLSADVRKLVPEYDKGVPMTAEQLMAHHTGIPHYDNLAVRTVRSYDDPHPWTDRITSLDMFVESDLVGDPGTLYCYSTPGFVLLGAVIERAGEQPYVDQVLERIARPLGMDSLRPDYIWEEIPERSAPYGTFASGPLRTEFDDISWKLPAGGWMSTVGDMGLFAAGLMGDELLTDAMKEHMWKLRSGSPGSVKGYALGINTGVFDGTRVVMHGGGQFGATTYLVCSPDTGHAVAIMANTEGVMLSDLAFETLSILLD